MPYAFEDCIETFETPLTNTAECTHTKVTLDKSFDPKDAHSHTGISSIQDGHVQLPNDTYRHSKT